MIAKIAPTLTLIPTTISQLQATDIDVHATSITGTQHNDHWNAAQRSLEHSTTIIKNTSSSQSYSQP
jgi:hypothetical protein